jgi:ribosomal-protein-serine acetyltransferase
VNPIYWDLGDGIEIRTFTPDDAEASFALVDANRERLRPWMIWEPTTTSVDDSRTFILRCLASETDLEGNGMWVDGRLAGGIGLRVDAQDAAGEIGYWIGGDFEGRGIITRACRRFFDFAFDELGLHRMELQAASGNTRSRAIAERLGMTEEGVMRDGIRVAGGYLDSVRYGILEDEWRARRVPA